MSSWSLIETGGGDAVRNMAIDWALLALRGEGAIPDTLRFYTWRGTAVSLGYSQDIDLELDLDLCRRNHVQAVIRPTGGALVLHGGDLTYSVVVGTERADPAEWAALSWRVGCALCRGLAQIGLSPTCVTRGEAAGIKNRGACFSAVSRHEIVVNGRKITGNARRRCGRAILQHGSIPLRKTSLSIADLMKGLSPEERERTRSELEAHSTAVEEEIGRIVSYGDLWPVILDSFRDDFGPVGGEGSLPDIVSSRAGEYAERVQSGPASRRKGRTRGLPQGEAALTGGGKEAI